MLSGHPLPSVAEYHDENTLFKVYDALREDCRLTEKQCREAITALQNRGILFREKAPTANPTGPVYRGTQGEAVRVDAGSTESTTS